MKKIYLSFILIIVIAFCMSGCKDKVNNYNENDNLFEIVRSMEQKDIHELFGEPSGILSGFLGDVYRLENGTQIIIYYDETQKVENVAVFDKDGNTTFGPQQSE